MVGDDRAGRGAEPRCAVARALGGDGGHDEGAARLAALEPDEDPGPVKRGRMDTEVALTIVLVAVVALLVAAQFAPDPLPDHARARRPRARG